MDTGCCLEDLPGAMNDKDWWWERESGNSILSAWINDDDDEVKKKGWRLFTIKVCEEATRIQGIQKANISGGRGVIKYTDCISAEE